MKIKKLSFDNKVFIKAHHLAKALKKAKKLFNENPNSFLLDVKSLLPNELKLYTFRLNKEYLCIFRIYNSEIEILTFTKN